MHRTIQHRTRHLISVPPGVSLCPRCLARPHRAYFHGQARSHVQMTENALVPVVDVRGCELVDRPHTRHPVHRPHALADILLGRLEVCADLFNNDAVVLSEHRALRVLDLHDAQLNRSVEQHRLVVSLADELQLGLESERITSVVQREIAALQQDRKQEKRVQLVDSGVPGTRERVCVPQAEPERTAGRQQRRILQDFGQNATYVSRVRARRLQDVDTIRLRTDDYAVQPQVGPV